MSMEQDLQDAIKLATAEGRTPGTVVLVGRGDETVYLEAFGNRMVTPVSQPMTTDTIFDLASVTKPLATATAIMQLAERGELSVEDPVSQYFPEFREGGEDEATLRHLLTHSAGLPAYKNYLSEWGEGLPVAERRSQVTADICRLPRRYPPGRGFGYSCLGFILLASLVEKICSEPLDVYSAREIFGPLGMTDTSFNPPPEMIDRCAATEPLPTGVLCGVVHDENARYLGGVGGNAGLFAPVGDVARFLRMVLKGGELEGARVLSPTSIESMTSPQLQVPGAVRGLGWDIDSAYSPQLRGHYFPPASFGHSGYTGTSVWADPASGVYLILLTNRVHFGREADISSLRRQAADIVAGHLLAGA